VIAGPRPRRLVVVVGTGTGVGKTHWSAAILAGVRAAGRVVAARKPAQSYAPEETATDAHLLAEASGQAPEDVCPPARWYPLPMAPPMAAEALGMAPPTMAVLLAPRWPPDVDLGVLEAAGGLRSPLALDGDGADLVAATAPDDVLLVADAGLGTISAVRLALHALAGVHDGPVVVALNRYAPGDELHEGNRAWLAERDGFDVVVDPAELVARWS
jgi:dethiobiotin synthetase